MKKPWPCLYLLLTCSASALAQSWRYDRARLCFVREEDTGAINVLTSWVWIADYRIPLIGGQAACIFVDPGAEDLLVTSTYPYEPESTDEKECKSPAKKLQLAPNEDRTFMVWPATKGGSYTCGWRIEAVAPSTSSRMAASGPRHASRECSGWITANPEITKTSNRRFFASLRMTAYVDAHSGRMGD
jgi:hypothetical protein